MPVKIGPGFTASPFRRDYAIVRALIIAVFGAEPLFRSQSMAFDRFVFSPPDQRAVIATETA
ncbi:hypothetical protein [Methylomonas sp. MgM2]